MPPLRQFDSWRIYVRPRTGPQSAHGYAAGSQRAYCLGQLRAYGWDRQIDGQTDGLRYRLMPALRRGHDNR